MALATRPKPKIQHKKRQARHHRHSKHYLKTYLPYLPMALIVALGIAVNSLWSHGSVLGVQQDFTDGSLLYATNQQRAAAQEANLTLDPQLSAAAQAKANDMAAKNYWSHTSPSGDTPWTFIANAGYQYETAGENLAYGFKDVDAAIKGWMSSPEHRANILNDQYQNVGFGIAESSDYQGKGPQVIVVAEYGRPAAAVANITFSVPTTTQNAPAAQVQGAQTETAARPVSRIEVISGNRANWALLVVAAVTGAAFAVFVTRHGMRLHRVAVRGEQFVVRHPWLDVSMVLVITVGCLLTRSSGIIR